MQRTDPGRFGSRCRSIDHLAVLHFRSNVHCEDNTTDHRQEKHQHCEKDTAAKEYYSRAYFFCLGGTHDGVGRVGLGPPVGFSPLFTPEFSQQKKNFSAQITMSTLPKWVIWCL